ncbi:molecular chaperone [Paraherbaspirillum soli]|uniref:Molecular chaperone n=1 Tax=Paraherbaspirillum soli TaxID=631222 RepID=A0ABW0MF84_9BURK
MSLHTPIFLRRSARTLAALLCAAGLMSAAHAGVTISGTRVIFDGAKREASVTVKNGPELPYVVQSWVEQMGDGDSAADAPRAPFLVAPPLLRLDAGKESMLRILRNGGDLPTDRESVFILNVKEIPPKSQEDNVLQLAIRSRVKLFYRPPGLEGKAAEAAKQLSWSLATGADGKPALKVANASRYHLTFGSVKVADADNNSQEIKGGMVAPLAELMLPLTPRKATTATVPQAPSSVTFTTINDFGGETDAETIRLAAPSASAK